VLDKQFIFIVGSPRSGTTWLQIMLSAHPSVCTTVELTLFDRYIPSWIKFWNKEQENIEERRLQKGLPFLWSEGEFLSFLRSFLEKTYEKVVATNPQATHILDKNPNYVFSQETINEFLPRARFIHVLRDGRDVVSSLLAAHRDMGFGPGNVEEAASLWRRSVLEAQKGKQFGDRYLVVRYEELLASGPNVLKNIFDFCDLKISHEEVTSIFDAHTFDKMKVRVDMPVEGLEGSIKHYRKGKEGSWHEDLSLWQRFIVNEVAGDLLFELGYIKDYKWWVETRWQAIMLPLLQMKKMSRMQVFERSKKALRIFLGRY
jgi:Sulfotransferase family